MSRRALIVGGGIAGLAAGLAARRAGWEVELIDRAPSLVGPAAGLLMWANGLSALGSLGIGQVQQLVQAPMNAALRNRDGAPFLPLNVSCTERGYPLMGGVSRTDLVTRLLEAFGADGVHLGQAVTRVAQDRHGVTATLADGRSACADILIGADGLHSAVRSAMYDDGLPEYAGYTAWRALIPFPVGQLTQGETWDTNAVFGQVAVPHGQVYWYASVPAEPDRPVGADERPQLLDRFGTWHTPIPELIARTPPGAILRNDLCDRPALTRWTDRRVTLVGDAAHPMIPSLAQGASQALEDAVVLGRELAVCTFPAAALANYEARRFRRACSFVDRSRLAWHLARHHGTVPVRVRDALARTLLPHADSRQLSWILATGF